MKRALISTVVLAVCIGVVSTKGAQLAPPPAADPFHRPLDQILDVNVRDGLVYYRALQSSRGALDRYVASLNVPTATYDGWSKEAKMAFWVNAYNAIVLQTVVSRLSDPRHEQRLPGGEHPADSRRIRSAEAPRRRPKRDARRDRQDDPAGVQRAAADARARTRSRRQRPAAERGIQRVASDGGARLASSLSS